MVAPKPAVDAPRSQCCSRLASPDTERPRTLRARDAAPGCGIARQRIPDILITGRVLEHWHTGSMTRRAEVLTLDPHPWCGTYPEDIDGKSARRIGWWCCSRPARGSIVLEVRDEGQRGSVFAASLRGKAANLLPSLRSTLSARSWSRNRHCNCVSHAELPRAIAKKNRFHLP